MAVIVKKTYRLEDYSIEVDRQELVRAGQRQHLASRPFQVLLYLIENRDRLVGRGELIERFWSGKDVYDETLTKCIGAIRKALDDRLDSPRFIETRYAEGYRYIGPFDDIASGGILIATEKRRDVRLVIEEEEVQQAEQLQRQPPSVHVAAAPSSPLFAKTAPRAVMLALALVTVLSASAFFVYRSGARSTVNAATGTPESRPINSVAVMPFMNLSDDPAEEYFSDGLTESFITELSRIKSLKVISRSSVFTFKGKETDPRDVGRRLGVAAVVEGSVLKTGDRVRVDVRLVSTEDGRVLWVGESYNRALKDVLTTRDEIACSVAAQLRLTLCGEAEPLKRYINNSDAYHVYLKGRYFFNNQYLDLDKVGPVKNLRKAAEYFEQAIKINPAYAPAYAGLADADTAIVWFSPEDPRPLVAQAQTAALQAVEIDDRLAEGHVALANVYIHEWNFEAAGQEYKRAITLNPGNALAHDGFSNYWMALGRTDEMIAENARAEELDPLNVYLVADRGVGFYMARRYDEAIAQFHKAAELSQYYGPVENIAMCYLEKGRFSEAIEQLQSLRKANAVKARIPETVIWLAVAYAKAGQRHEAEHLLGQMKGLSRKQYVPKTFLAYVYAALGEKEQAFAMLESAYREHDSTLIGLKTHPWFDPLRSDPRFSDLLRRANLPG